MKRLCALHHASLLILVLLTTSTVAYGVPTSLAPERAPDQVFINFQAIDNRKDLTAAQKTATKDKVKQELLANFNRGKERIQITDDFRNANRAILVVDTASPYFGVYTGSPNVELYLGTFMDYPVAALPASFKTGGDWDPAKLGKALGTIAAHELAHAYAGGHKKTPADANKMNPTFWTELATKDYKLDDIVLKTVDENIGKKSCCKPDQIKDYASVTVHWEKDIFPVTPESGVYSEAKSVEFVLSYSTSSLPAGWAIDLGWLTNDSDLGSLDGSSQFDFVYNAALDGAFDSLITAFDHWTLNPALAVFDGFVRKLVPLSWDGLRLDDFIVNWESISVARNASFSWKNIDGFLDVTVNVDTRAYGVLTTTNGVAVPGPASSFLVGAGMLVLLQCLRRKGPRSS